MNQLLACCKHPLAVTFVDDEKRYLAGMQLKFSRNFFSYCFNEPQEAIKFLTKNNDIKLFDKNAIHWLEQDDNGNGIAQIQMSSFYQQIYNQERYRKVGVVVADFAMPGMNGIEFFKKIVDLPIKKNHANWAGNSECCS